MPEEPSDRLVDQRVRNRIIEALEDLALGDEYLHAVGDVEYFNWFFDWIDDDAPDDWRTLSTFTDAEVARIESVLAAMLQALEVAGRLDTAALAVSGWPARVAPIAREAVTAMLARGRFSEDDEENEPSGN